MFLPNTAKAQLSSSVRWCSANASSLPSRSTAERGAKAHTGCGHSCFLPSMRGLNFEARLLRHFSAQLDGSIGWLFKCDVVPVSSGTPAWQHFPLNPFFLFIKNKTAWASEKPVCKIKVCIKARYEKLSAWQAVAIWRCIYLSGNWLRARNRETIPYKQQH